MGDSRKYPYPTMGGIFIWIPPCLRKLQNAQPPLALGIPNRSTPPCLRNSVIIQTPLGKCCFFLPTDLKKPSLYSKHLYQTEIDPFAPSERKKRTFSTANNQRCVMTNSGRLSDILHCNLPRQNVHCR